MKTVPYTANSLTPTVTNNPGDSEYLIMSQKGATKLATGEAEVKTFEDAPKDGKMYVRKDGQWVSIELPNA